MISNSKMETMNVPEGSVCNCCGEHIDEEERYLDCDTRFEYDSKYFQDGERHQGKICMKCLARLIKDLNMGNQLIDENTYAKIIKGFKIEPEGFGVVHMSFDDEIFANFEEWKRE